MSPEVLVNIAGGVYLVVGAICGWLLNRHDSHGGLLVYSCVVCAALAPVALASVLMMPWDRRRRERQAVREWGEDSPVFVARERRRIRL